MLLDNVQLFNIGLSYAPISVSFSVIFSCLISNFESVIDLSLGFNFHMESEPLYIDFSPSKLLFQVQHCWLGAHSANWREHELKYEPISKDHLDSIQFLQMERWNGDIVERERSIQGYHWGRSQFNCRENKMAQQEGWGLWCFVSKYFKIPPLSSWFIEIS